MQNVVKYLILWMIIFFAPLYLIAQTSNHRSNGKGIRYIDMSSSIRTMPSVLIAKDTCRQGSISAIHSRSHKGILYVYTCSCQPDSIHLAFAGNEKRHPDIIFRESLYAPDSIVSTGIDVCSTNDKKGNDILFLFPRQGVMQSSVFNEAEQSGWSNFSLINNYSYNGISSVFRNRHGVLTAFFSNSDLSIPEGPKPIYKIKSYDQGVSWELPEIAVKHNLYNLDYVYVIRAEQDKQNRLYMLAGDSSRSLVFLSISKNEGESWSYPTLLPDFLDGYGHRLSIIGETAYVLFEKKFQYPGDDSTTTTSTNLLLWKGSVKDLENKNKGTAIYRLAKSQVNASHNLQAAVIPLAKDQLRVVLGPQWVDIDSTALKSYSLHMEAK